MPAKVKDSNPWKIIGLILIGILIGYIIGSYNLAGLNPPEKADKDTNPTVAEVKPTEEEPPEIQIIDEDGDPFLGSNTAPVVVVDFSDFQCPFCNKFQTTIMPGLKTDYIDTGKVKYVYRDFALNIHPKATNAAMAAECANDQGKYWEMHTAIFETQAVWGAAADVNESLVTIAKDAGLNSTLLSTCLNDEKYLDEVNKDREAAISYGARGTPTLFINGKILRGVPRSYESFKALIEEELS